MRRAAWLVSLVVPPLGKKPPGTPKPIPLWARSCAAAPDPSFRWRRHQRQRRLGRLPFPTAETRATPARSALSVLVLRDGSDSHGGDVGLDDERVCARRSCVLATAQLGIATGGEVEESGAAHRRQTGVAGIGSHRSALDRGRESRSGTSE